jgi:DNA-binding NtrC family response regulator
MDFILIQGRINMAIILAIDDMEDAANLIRRILKRLGHEVSAFSDEEEAIKFAADHTIDLAILDIKLKKMNGVEVLAELKQINPQMKAIMLTGYPTMETAKASLKLGVSDYCVKPIDNDELEAKVTKALAE